MNGSGSETASGLVWLLILILGFYFVAIRPNRRRLRAMQQVQSAVAPGREVITSAGLYATVVSLDDDTVTLEIAPGVNARFARGAVMRLVDPAGVPETSNNPSQEK